MSNEPYNMNQQMPNNNQPQDGRRTINPLANYQFSPDELRVLRQCNSESFFQRSLPIGTAFGLGTYFGVKNGYLRPSLKYGAVPKVVVSVIFGYFVGKFSYQKKCAEKIMQLPNSKLAEVLKAKRKGAFYENLTPDTGFGTGIGMAPFSTPASDHYSDETLKTAKQCSALDLDTDRPIQSGLDETQRLNVDSPNKYAYEEDLQLQPPQAPVTYDELRKKNRDDYQKRNFGSGSVNTPPMIPNDQPTVIRARKPEDDTTPLPKGTKNKYGDVWT